MYFCPCQWIPSYLNFIINMLLQRLSSWYLGWIVLWHDLLVACLYKMPLLHCFKYLQGCLWISLANFFHTLPVSYPQLPLLVSPLSIITFQLSPFAFFVLPLCTGGTSLKHLLSNCIVIPVISFKMPTLLWRLCKNSVG